MLKYSQGAGDKMQKFELAATIRVRYAETDRMGIVYNGNYLSWFEIARTELCRNWGKPYSYWESCGIMLPVAESYCRYKQPARYDDILQLWCGVKELKPYSIKFCYRIILQDKSALLAEGWTKHAFTDASGQLLKTEHEFYSWIKALLTENA